MNTLTALQLLNALLAAAGNAVIMAGKISVIINAANAEGRDVSAEELATAERESDAATEQLKERINAVLVRDE